VPGFALNAINIHRIHYPLLRYLIILEPAAAAKGGSHTVT